MDDKTREFFKSRLANAVIKEDVFRDQLSFYIKPQYLLEVCQALLEDTELDIKYLSDITSLDWLNHEQAADGRFEVIYNLYSLSHHYRLLLKVRLPESNPAIQTLTTLWSSANWLEREVYDLMGIEFEGHPDLTRILTPDDLEGHPLRKDFPLTWEQPAFGWNKDDPPEVIR
jgi:NADH-quinone oxidoreductase subunit C